MTTPMAPQQGGSDNVFLRKLGPFPTWVWMIFVLLVALLYHLYAKNKAGNTAENVASPSTVNTPGGVDASLVPQFVNQTYTNTTPPPSDLNVTLSGNPSQPVVNQQEGTPGATVTGISVTPYKNKTDIGFGLIPGNKNGYTVQVIDSNNHYVYNSTVPSNHPVLPALKPGKYKVLVTGKGYVGTVTKNITVGKNLKNG